MIEITYHPILGAKYTFIDTPLNRKEKRYIEKCINKTAKKYHK